MSELTMTLCSSCEGESLAADTLLYKYYSVDSFLYLWQFNRLLFRRITDWPDAYEGMIYEFLRKVKKRQSVDIAPAQEYFGCCWTLQQDDPRLHSDQGDVSTANAELAKNGSASMWESYCHSGGVRIAVRFENLISLLHEALGAGQLYHGTACYKPENSWKHALGERDPVCSLFTKRIAFRYESEYRFIYIPEEASQGGVGIQFDNFYDLIDEVLIAPPISHRCWVARTLYNTVVNGLVDPDRPTNQKNNSKYCRISQLYGEVSEQIGHVHMDCKDRGKNA
jgi:hypothetical protein